MPRVGQYPEETPVDDLARRLAILEGIETITLKEGTGQFTAGVATDVITHGLGVVPASVFITPRDLISGEGPWVTTETSTTFTVNRGGPFGTVVDFYWLAIA